VLVRQVETGRASEVIEKRRRVVSGSEPKGVPGREREEPRTTPYELVFSEGEFESVIFPRIREEAQTEGVETLTRQRFDFLSTAGDVVREIVPEDAPAEALEQYRSILHHAYHHWREGRRLYTFDRAVSRFMVETSPSLEGWHFTAPGRSLYLQLPANLFWSSVSPEMTPEPLDGFFVTIAPGEDAGGRPYEQLSILSVLGIRRSRAGFSVIPVESQIGEGMDRPWEGSTREDGDFQNTLPGGEMSGLYTVLTAGEVVKLVARALWFVDRFPESVVEEPGVPPRGDAGDPPPSLLSHWRVTLQGEQTESGDGGEEPLPPA